jgi:hypothetical protein
MNGCGSGLTHAAGKALHRRLPVPLKLSAEQSDEPEPAGECSPVFFHAFVHTESSPNLQKLILCFSRRCDSMIMPDRKPAELKQRGECE